MNDLLKVLDMSEDEQWKWLWENRQLTHIGWNMTATRNMILADLAFRLRDESMRENSDNWALACWYVQQWISFHKIETYESPDLDGLLNADHEILSKSPIHWIITARIAKEKEDD